jgi:microsomal dipeptidase-like Zn-dependent dipeptidase
VKKGTLRTPTTLQKEVCCGKSSKIIRQDHDDLPIPEITDYVKQIEHIATSLGFSHICITGSYLDKEEYWRKMDETDKAMDMYEDNWFVHLGIVYDFGKGTFHLGKKE